MKVRVDLGLPIKQLLVSLVLLVIADGLISQSVIASGVGSEGNPFLQTLVGDAKFLPLKIGGALLVAIVLWDIYRRTPKLGIAASAACVALYTGIVYWNLVVYLLGGAG
ncbi:MAG: hypothetical protein A2147_08900 [Chloroflexi bacterium RBG_16_57_8]|nr:MAG: hypothetical protein A2147_08900 [Chloroflexi bacterium RBG_16_57_8]